MRIFFTMFVAAFLVSSAFCNGSAQAADKGKKDAGGKVSVMGKVSTVKTDVDKFTSIKLTGTDGVVYNISIDDKGKDLASKYEGISAVVNGSVTEKDKEKWLTVDSIGDKKKKKK